LVKSSTMVVEKLPLTFPGFTSVAYF